MRAAIENHPLSSVVRPAFRIRMKDGHIDARDEVLHPEIVLPVQFANAGCVSDPIESETVGLLD